MNRFTTFIAAAGAAASLAAPVGLLASASAAPPVSDVAVRTAPECGNGDLLATYKSKGGAVGTEHGVIRLTNVSDAACTTRGFGGLSYVGDGDGTQIGAAATRDHHSRTRTVVLQPGDTAHSRVAETVAQNYPKKKCRPTPVDGFRVYVPDATTSQYVAHPTTGCARSKVQLVSHRAYH